VFDRMPQRTHLLRARAGDAHARVTSVELFFDLVFVFAVTQLSHLLRRPGVDGGDSARVSRGLRQQRRDVVDLFRYRRRAGQPADRALRRPGRLGRLAYTYVHILIVMGIIVAAVADELILAHPAGHTELKLAAAVLGGPRAVRRWEPRGAGGRRPRRRGGMGDALAQVGLAQVGERQGGDDMTGTGFALAIHGGAGTMPRAAMTPEA
jgi:hypothetical protein